MTTAPPGWYPDPTPPSGVPPLLRWWDGQRWTDQYGPAQPPAHMPATTPDGQTLAGFGERLAAYVVDALIVGPIGILLALPFLVPAFRGVFDQMDEARDEAERGGNPDFFLFDSEFALLMLGAGLVSLLVSMVYEVGFLRWKQATPGKLALGLRVRLRESPELPLRAIFLRWVVKNAGNIASQVPFAGGLIAAAWLVNFLWPLWDEKRQALHDKAAATNVVIVR